MAKKSNPSKQALVVGLATLQGVTMQDLARGARVHVSTVYRVVRGEKASARVDHYIAKRLGITAQMLRKVGKQ